MPTKKKPSPRSKGGQPDPKRDAKGVYDAVTVAQASGLKIADAVENARAAYNAVAKQLAAVTGDLKPDQTETTKGWVILIYMAVTSPELKEILERDLAEMATRLRLLSSDRLRVYALMDTPEGNYTTRHVLHRPAPGEPGDPQVMKHTAGQAPVLGRKGAFLADFIKWRFDSLPAVTPPVAFDKTMLMLWGHSQGVASALSKPGSPAYAMVGNGGFGFNEFSGDSLNLPQMRRAIAAGLPAGRCIDVLSFDSCFMSAAEVSAEFQPRTPVHQPAPEEPHDDSAARVEFVVASQSAVLLDGLDYGRIVDVFIEKGHDVSPEKLCRGLLEQASSTTDSPVSLSMLYTGGCSSADKEQASFAALDKAMRVLVDELCQVLDIDPVQPTPQSPPERPRRSHRLAARGGRFQGKVTPTGDVNRSEWLRIRDAFETATWHRVRQFIDLGDLCRRLANNCRTENLRRGALQVLKALELPETHDGEHLVVDVRSLHPLLLSGVSLYCPWLFPTPEETRRGAWNAVVDLYDYATDLWFNRGDGSWGAFVYHAKHVLEEARQRAINTELADLRAAAQRGNGHVDPVAPAVASDAVPQRFRDKGGRDGFQTAEPAGAAAPAASAARPQFRAGLAENAAAQRPVDQVAICPKV